MNALRERISRWRPARRLHRRIAGAALSRAFARREGREPFVDFTCIVCGARVRAPRSAVAGRETPACVRCGSTLRFRQIVHALSCELLGRAMPAPEFPRSDLRGAGLSDAWAYAEVLEDRFDYVNTFYHRRPRLDIAAPEAHWHERFDFVVASEVFEHVPPPVEKAFEGLRRILRPGGLCVFSVPWVEGSETREHFPELHRWRLAREGGAWVLHNTTVDGRSQRFDRLRFHGGPGSTLEMRVFARDDLVRRIEGAGFVDVRVWSDDVPQFGIVHERSEGAILTFRRPRGELPRAHGG